MKLFVAGGVYTVLMFAAFVFSDDRAVWKSLLGAVVAGALFTLLTWLYERRAPTGRSARQQS